MDLFFFYEKTAGEKLSVVLMRFNKKRLEEKLKLKNNTLLSVGDVTSINLTVLEGGVQSNAVPSKLTVMFDCRLSVDVDPGEFETWVEGIFEEAGNEVKVEYVNKKKRIDPTKLNAENIWWVTLKKQFDEMKIEVMPRICPATTDSRYIRSLGIPALNFSPMNHTEMKLHDNNEYLNFKCFLMVY